MSVNREVAAEAIAVLRAHEVGEVVICAGARNAPLLVPLLELRDRGELRVWHHFDERAAAFFALGRIRRTRAPVAVVTTSGTAVAELLPATVEAHYAGLPLVLLTADRPASFRGSGAPQAIEQEQIFGCYAACASSGQDALGWGGRSPLHLNVCFDEPVAGETDHLDIPAWTRGEPSTSPAQPKPAWPDLPDPVILVGELDESLRGEVCDWIRDCRAPVWCEATSGLREERGWRNRAALDERDLAAWNVGSVLRFGGVPSLRFWRDLESRPGLPVLSLTPTGFSGLARDSDVFPLEPGCLRDVPPVGADGRFPRRSEELEACLSRHPRSEPGLVRRLSEVIPAEAIVFLGNSLPIREWNSAATVDVPHPRCFANRGANGIDGEVSTFLGLAADGGESWGIFGDLTALYDLNAPWIDRQFDGGRRRIVVLNNGGGRIFSRLPSMRDLAEERKRVSENRHDLTFEHWAGLWGWNHVRWNGEFPFPDIDGDRALVEIEVDGEETEKFWAERAG